MIKAAHDFWKCFTTIYVADLDTPTIKPKRAVGYDAETVRAYFALKEKLEEVGML